LLRGRVRRVPRYHGGVAFALGLGLLGALFLWSMTRSSRAQASNRAAQHATFFSGDWDEALRLLPQVEKFYGKSSGSALYIRVNALHGQGDVDGAVAAARLLLPYSHPLDPWVWPNASVNAFTSAGLYVEALEAGRQAEEERSDNGPRLRSPTWALMQVNLAEARYNLGQWKEAWVLLEDLDELAARAPIAADGLAIQRAWILAHQGKGEEARVELGKRDFAGIPPTFAAETHYARGAAYLAAGQPAEALEQIQLGAKGALRTSSKRNGLFMLARVALAQGRLDEAERLCREASEHPYRGQGGEGLLLWGDILQRLNRKGEAVGAWRLAVERDPQSESARLAAERLTAEEA
jgi:tetratricopeptide (TPR) repeat protein